MTGVVWLYDYTPRLLHRKFARVHPHSCSVQVRAFVLYGHHTRYYNEWYFCEIYTGHRPMQASAAPYDLTFLPLRHESHLNGRRRDLPSSLTLLCLLCITSPCPVAVTIGFRWHLPLSFIILLCNRTRKEFWKPCAFRRQERECIILMCWMLCLSTCCIYICTKLSYPEDKSRRSLTKGRCVWCEYKATHPIDLW
jgi:hypothetical protein